MSEGAPSLGLAARLLRRAEGSVTALRPQIADTFSADATQEAPLLERTEVIAATAPASSRQAPNPPAAAAPQSLPEPPPFRLMPSAPPRLYPANLRPNAARPPSEPEVEADASVPTDLPLPATATRDAASPPLPRREEWRADSLSTAIMQLLGPQLAETYTAASTSEPQPALDAFATTGFAVPIAAVPAANMDTAAAAPSEQAPVQVYIGELIIAPEPRAPVREAAPRAAWEPPLSLADYRASRSRERG